MDSSQSATARLDVALVGAGVVGTAVAELLCRRGHSIVAVASRSREHAERAAARLDSEVRDLERLPRCDLVLLGVADDALDDVTARVSSAIEAGTLVAHFAGAVGVAPLASVAARGGRPVALHPVQTCPDADTAIARLPGSAWGITCSDDVAEVVTRIVSDDLEGVPVRVDERDRSLWHAAAVVTANGIAALLATGEAILDVIGVDNGIDVLGPLASGAVQNARDRGGGTATLTGPVVRGDDATLRRHVTEVEERAPELLPVYARIAKTVVAAARRGGRIDAGTEARLLDALTS